MSEHTEQCLVIQWFDMQYKQFSGRLFAVPNGARTSIGTACKLKREGLRKGVPDLWLPVKTARFSGLVIEMKDTKGKVSDEQKDWLAFLVNQGFKTDVCYSFEDAQKTITDYFDYANE